MRLFSQNEMNSCTEKPQWFEVEYQRFHHTLTDPQFPCYLGTQAEKNGEIYYAYTEEDWSDLPRTMVDYTEIDRKNNGTSLTLALFFKPDPSMERLEDYKNQFWDVLRYLHTHDPLPWPQEQPFDPAEQMWLFCFNGTPFIVFATTPLYKKRKSRHSGNGLVIIFQPIALFAGFMPGKIAGVKVRKKIRARVEAYDHLPAHPALGDEQGYVQHPWQHYFLPDDNEPVQGKCPFYCNRRLRET